MRAQLRTAFSIIGLTMAIVGTAAAQGRTVTHALTAVVPSIVQVEVVAGQFGPGGYPLVRVRTKIGRSGPNWPTGSRPKSSAAPPSGSRG